jgi:hypothetical protein
MRGAAGRVVDELHYLAAKRAGALNALVLAERNLFLVAVRRRPVCH